MENKGSIAIVGCGLIGKAWAIAFARGGHAVRLYDSEGGTVGRAMVWITATAREMADYGLLDGQAPEEVGVRIAPAQSLAEALDGVIHVQESTPEKLEGKTNLFSALDAATPAEAVIASSTSALLPSSFSGHVKGRNRCLVAHPLNPPHLIPAIEVVPSPWTSPEALERTRCLMTGIGQKPIMMKAEIEGFLMNRLQGALLEECFRLVDADIVDVEDVDVAIRDGLALRWSFMGPFETIDLNAPGGVQDYVERYQPAYARIFAEQKMREVDWHGPVLDRILAARRGRLALDAVAERQAWRDRKLMSVAAYRRLEHVEAGD